MKVRGIYFVQRHRAPFPQGTLPLRLASLCPDLYDLASISAGCSDGRKGKPHSFPPPFHFFPEVTIVSDYSFPLLQSTESFLGWKKELDTFLSVEGGRYVCRGEIMTVSVPFVNHIS